MDFAQLLAQGSMPPTSQNIFEEGASIISFKVVKKGVLDYDNLKRLLVDEPAKYPGSSGCRESKRRQSFRLTEDLSADAGYSFLPRLLERRRLRRHSPDQRQSERYQAHSWLDRRVRLGNGSRLYASVSKPISSRQGCVFSSSFEVLQHPRQRRTSRSIPPSPSRRRTQRRASLCPRLHGRWDTNSITGDHRWRDWRCCV